MTDQLQRVGRKALLTSQTLEGRAEHRTQGGAVLYGAPMLSDAEGILQVVVTNHKGVVHNTTYSEAF
jgi:hypothetical protein